MRRLGRSLVAWLALALAAFAQAQPAGTPGILPPESTLAPAHPVAFVDFEPMLYDERLLSGRINLEKNEYLVGEPIYWEFEVVNNGDVVKEFQIFPSYTGDVNCQILLPGGLPRRYSGDDLNEVGVRTVHNLLPGERRYIHFRIYQDDTRLNAGPAKLLFPSATEAALRIDVTYDVDKVRQAFRSETLRITIKEPVGRQAECRALLESSGAVGAMQRMRATPQEIPALEQILALYPDTVYAPHLAYSLATGYFMHARRSFPVDRRMMRAAIKGYETLLQLNPVLYLREASLYNLSQCYMFLEDYQAFVAWFDKYLDDYGDRGRFNFQNNPWVKQYRQRKEPDPGPFWYYYP